MFILTAEVLDISLGNYVQKKKSLIYRNKYRFIVQ